LRQGSWLERGCESHPPSWAEAIAHYQKTLEIRPNFAPACNSLAWLLATSPDPSVRNGAKAIELARRVEQLTGGKNPPVLGTLAAAYAEAGRFPEAVAGAQETHDVALAQGDRALAAKSLELVECFRSGRPFHDGP
jgi:tetratricopeptide (TPR) repeat protein